MDNANSLVNVEENQAWVGVMIGGISKIASMLTFCSILGGCAGLVLNQPADRVLIRAGGEPLRAPDGSAMLSAQAYADDYLDYVLLASQAYLGKPAETNIETPSTLSEGSIRSGCDAEGSVTPCIGERALAAYANERISKWRLIYSADESTGAPCRRSAWSCWHRLRDVYAQIWVRKGTVCDEAVIAFRGTQGPNPADWFSNLRWFTRFYPTFDLYKQVQDATSVYFQKIRESGCWRKGVTKIVATGHSLGGGLAQQAAFRGGIEENGAAGPDGRFDRVVVFDTSFVTGATDINSRDRAENARGLRIEKVYEDGEILAYPQFLLRQIIPQTACNPQIVTIRFNIARGLPTSQHSIWTLKTALLRWSLMQKYSPQQKIRIEPPPLASCR